MSCSEDGYTITQQSTFVFICFHTYMTESQVILAKMFARNLYCIFETPHTDETQRRIDGVLKTLENIYGVQ